MSVKIYIDRQELVGYTSLTLQRSKDNLVGSATVGVFMSWTPSNPVIPAAIKGTEMLIYIGDHLSFNGIIDSRVDASSKKAERNGPESAATAHALSANSYTVTIKARGKNKYLIDSSHQHETGTLLRPSNRSAIADLVAPWGTEVEWLAENIDLDRLRLRDGGRVVDELHRIAEMCGLYIFETREGLLRITDPDTEADGGEALVLGRNILGFSAEQSENKEKSEVVVKGQRTENGVWGEEAVIPTLVKVADGTVKGLLPEIVHLYGNATEDLLNKRAAYESNKRNSTSKKVTVETFHVQQSDGEPWELGNVHQVVIPPAEINDSLEITALTFNVEAQGTLTTSITLAPTNTSVSGNNASSGSKWSPPSLETVVEEKIDDFEIEFGGVGGPPPPVKLPNNK